MLNLKTYCFSDKNPQIYRRHIWGICGADVGIRTPEASLKTYTISNRAPSASSDTSAFDDRYYNLVDNKMQGDNYDYKKI